ncbi:hypothetical protein HYX58_05470 [Candidatus Dependentiae bacterium]|nr:hypothetical protein [Candidatus Dependentiae bacterium]
MKLHSLFFFAFFFPALAMEEPKAEQKKCWISKKLSGCEHYHVKLSEIPSEQSPGDLFDFFNIEVNAPDELCVMSSLQLDKQEQLEYVGTALMGINYQPEKNTLFLAGIELAIKEKLKKEIEHRAKKSPKVPPSPKNMKEVVQLLPETAQSLKKQIADLPKVKTVRRTKSEMPILHEHSKHLQPSIAVQSNEIPKIETKLDNRPSLSWAQRNTKTFAVLIGIGACAATLALQWGIKKMPNWQSALFTK